MSKAWILAVGAVLGSSALLIAGIGEPPAPETGAISKGDRLQMEFSVACGSGVVSDVGSGCESLASRVSWTKPGVDFHTTSYQADATTTVLVKRRIER